MWKEMSGGCSSNEKQQWLPSSNLLDARKREASNTQSLQCACCVYTIYVTHGPHTVPLYKVPLQYHDIRYIRIRHPHDAKNRSKRDSINVVVHVDGVKTTSLNCGHQRGDCPPLRCWTRTATVEWYWQGKTEELREEPVPVPLCPPQILHRRVRVRTQASALTGRRLTAWAMARTDMTLNL
jgi:hypothetical protein